MEMTASPTLFLCGPQRDYSVKTLALPANNCHCMSIDPLPRMWHPNTPQINFFNLQQKCNFKGPERWRKP